MIQRILILASLLVLSGCASVPIAEDISQQQALQIVSLLQKNGISAIAERGRGNRTQYTVAVKRSTYSEAVGVLAAHNLPSQEKETFSDFVVPQSFLPDSKQTEALRLDHALGLQLEELVQSWPGVLRAKAIVRQYFGPQDQGSSSVSLFLVVDPSFEGTEDSLSELAMQVIPGAEREEVLISVQKVEQLVEPMSFIFQGSSREADKVLSVPLVPFVFGIKLPEEDYLSMLLFLGGLALLLLGVGALAGFWVAYVKSEITRPSAPTTMSQRLSAPERTQTLEHHVPEVE